MNATDLVSRLAEHKSLRSVPREELAWLASHGIPRELAPGDVLTARDTRVEGLFLVLSGRVAMFVDRGTGLQKIVEWRQGDVTGLLPYSRLVSPPGDIVAQEPTTVLAVHSSHFPEMTRECYEITSALVHIMVDRVRGVTSNDLHDEKMVSLGKLSAGLAHELNNPASAIERGAALLHETLAEFEQAILAFNASELTELQFAAVNAVRELCVGARTHEMRSPLERAEHEEALAGWLAGHKVDMATAEALVDTAVTFGALDKLAMAVDRPTLNAVLRWCAAGCLVRDLASDIQDAATRISGLVGAIKGFTHMDQANCAEPVDLIQGLRNTVTVLKSKAQMKSAIVVVDVEPGLPRVRGYSGELNQIWGNLIDNALDAISQSGRVEVCASREHENVVVRVIDNGAGIPPKVQERIFDPFFTTKPLGQGTGLGLDIVRRLVRHNEGAIAVESQPGRTEFRVTLPLADIRSEGATA